MNAEISRESSGSRAWIAREKWRPTFDDYRDERTILHSESLRHTAMLSTKMLGVGYSEKGRLRLGSGSEGKGRVVSKATGKETEHSTIFESKNSQRKSLEYVTLAWN